MKYHSTTVVLTALACTLPSLPSAEAHTSFPSPISSDSVVELDPGETVSIAPKEGHNAIAER